MRILVVEDDADLNELIRRRLKKEGYGADGCFDGEEALNYLSSADYDLMITDIMMPRQDGLSLVRQLRQQGNSMPVIFLSARDSVEDRVTGLDVGADDYLIKPFAFEELLARIRVLLRNPPQNRSAVLTVGDLTLDQDTREVRRGSQKITLSSREFSLLRYMMLNSGIVLSRSTLEEHIWDFDYSGSSNVIDVYIRYLRKKLDEGRTPKLIHTVRGAGYVLRAEEPAPGGFL